MTPSPPGFQNTPQGSGCFPFSIPRAITFSNRVPHNRTVTGSAGNQALFNQSNDDTAMTSCRQSDTNSMVKYYSRRALENDKADTSQRNESNSGNPAQQMTFNQQRSSNGFEGQTSDIDVKPSPCQLVSNWHQSPSLKRNEPSKDQISELQNKRQKFNECNSSNHTTQSDNSACASPAHAQLQDQVSTGILTTGSQYHPANNELTLENCKSERETW